MRSIRIALLALVSGAAVMQPVVAHADTVTHTDSRADVLSAGIESDSTTLVPERADGDIVSTAVSHRRHSVVVTIRLAELTTGVDASVDLVRLRTNKGRVRDITVMAAKGAWGGRASMETARGKHVRCHVGRVINYATNTVVVTTPRRCLGSPRWVQAGIGHIGIADKTFYVDDANTNGTLGNNLVLGARVFR